ncbi:FadR/GntR family transcriptional regulator [Caulobacter soli]|uniref:FadR/GntR family transcriptional regulator n=1 Tax=Caulobacter soli TaxID=2708539 RepID=UPI0013EA6AA5|nr:FCD domain-containing protein [Caulobacter soli]
MPKGKPATTSQSQRLVAATAEKMRDLILRQDPDAMIGSLPDLAASMGVGIATVQQAARILEHEGLLSVRRGPGGGYFGRRPDPAALERALAAYMRVRGADDYEALEMMTLLDCELIPAAARLATPPALVEMRALRDRIDVCVTPEQRITFEDDFHAILFRIVNRSLIELLAQVAMRFYRSAPIPMIFDGDEGRAAWRAWRHQVIDAIIAQDPERARFEAERHRRLLLQKLERDRDAAGPSIPSDV